RDAPGVEPGNLPGGRTGRQAAADREAAGVDGRRCSGDGSGCARGRRRAHDGPDAPLHARPGASAGLSGGRRPAGVPCPGKAGRGVLLEIGIHLLDLIRFLTGAEAVEAVADLEQRHTTRVEDLALARFRLSNGVSCYVEVSRVSGGRLCRVEAVGRAGQLIADVDRSLLTWIEGRMVTETEAVPDRPTVIAVLETFA